MKSKLLLIPSLAFAVSSASATISITDGTAYTQDFDKAVFATDFADTGTTDPDFWTGAGTLGSGDNITDNSSWGNNSTFTGWFRQVSVGGQTNRSDKDFLGEQKGGTIRFGLAGNGGTYNTTTWPIGEDTSLGVVMQGADGQVSFGALFRNDTGAALTGANISYTGEQWFRSQTAGGQLEFQYKVIETNPLPGWLINDETGWSDANDLDFAAITSGTSNLKRNGNNASFQSAESGSIAFTADADEFVAIRWQYTSTQAAVQAGLFVDDFSIAFVVPEPSSYALLAGGLALLSVMVRRRR